MFGAHQVCNQSCCFHRSCVGPYSDLNGINVVKSCIDNGTDYVDISGEPLYIESVVDKYYNEAANNKCLIVSACGWDSLPAEMGTLMCSAILRERGVSPVSVEMTHMMAGGGSAVGSRYLRDHHG